MTPDRPVATTRNIRAEGEAYDDGRRFRFSFEEDLTAIAFAAYGDSRNARLTIEWYREGKGEVGKLVLGRAAVDVLRDLLG